MRDPLCSFAIRYKSGGMRCETLSCCGTNGVPAGDVPKEAPSLSPKQEAYLAKIKETWRTCEPDSKKDVPLE